MSVLKSVRTMLRASCYVTKLALDASDRKFSLFSRLVKFPLMPVVLITYVNDNHAVPYKL